MIKYGTPPRDVDIYLNGRYYNTFHRCMMPIEKLQRDLAEAIIIGDGKIVLIERDEPGRPTLMA